MPKDVSATDFAQEQLLHGIIEEGHRFPGKGVSAREPEAQDVVLHSSS